MYILWDFLEDAPAQKQVKVFRTIIEADIEKLNNINGLTDAHLVDWWEVIDLRSAEYANKYLAYWS